MNKIVALTMFGMLTAVIILQLLILDEIKKPKTIQITNSQQVAPQSPSAQQAASQPNLADLQKKYTAIETRYLLLQNMTQEEWDAEGVRMGEDAAKRAPSLEAAREQNKKWLDELTAQMNALSAKSQ